MKKSTLFLMLTLMLLLAACQPFAATAQPSSAAPTLAPTAAQASPTQEKPAVPQTPDARSDYAPDPKDSGMSRSKFTIKSISLTPTDGKPGYFDLMAEGSLPTPCNLPRVVINPPDAEKKIAVEAYSVVATDMMCTQVIKPFSGKLAEIGGYPSGTYNVVVNGRALGELTVP